METAEKALLKELKQFIVRRLRLPADPAGIADDATLIGGGLDLDSIDILELVVGLEKEYGVKIRDMEEGRRALASVSHLAAYLTAKRPAAGEG